MIRGMKEKWIRCIRFIWTLLAEAAPPFVEKHAEGS
jgi:hypothetical protein